ncbi:MULTISPECIES: sulfate ABC transporter substrate-binding protein [Hyphomicrobium]|jgi:sulfate transport system substrate-binding protein|uniref:sulfate ABC transporter substrate-binding protein n=1 Tax=Hyphomicrobium TaxID=81 RepID=UPI00036F494C|nr:MULTISPECIES: sulfate ABC transporter substrate-binding protein [Hyphomicrobium]WBT37647.1 sulfate ABC transporter substrate-binding protein [Hyphomicrobium sp. DMF-1]HML41597.1 sulfate ABC transporter substrate-binding protein [Hyphomicrobium zavarzinii]
MSLALLSRRTALALGLSVGLAGLAAASNAAELLNVSYDPTRELYQEFNAAFIKHWKSTGGEDLTIKQSHGGSGKQARAVIDGLEADVVTLALARDIDGIADKGKLLPADWQKRLPHNSTPYTSTIVFLVRKGNEKGIKDWDDLVKDGVQVITPNPKTSGGAQWNYLAAWEYAKRKYGGDEQAKDFVKRLYKNVPVLDSGARGSTTTFVERGVGDVFISWENEAFLALKELGPDKFEIVVPTISILAEPPVAVIDKNVDKKGTRKIAEAYLNYLYSPEGQEIAGKNFYRPTDQKVAEKYASQFPKINLFKIDDAFGGWANAYKTHFADGGTFDQIYVPGSKS